MQFPDDSLNENVFIRNEFENKIKMKQIAIYLIRKQVSVRNWNNFIGEKIKLNEKLTEIEEERFFKVVPVFLNYILFWCYSIRLVSYPHPSVWKPYLIDNITPQDNDYIH